VCCQFKIVLTLKITAKFPNAIAAWCNFQFASFIQFNEGKGKKKLKKGYACYLCVKTPADTWIYCVAKIHFFKKQKPKPDTSLYFVYFKMGKICCKTMKQELYVIVLA